MTNETFAMHLGECLYWMLKKKTFNDFSLSVPDIMQTVARYPANGLLGTASARKEAMQIFLRGLYKQIHGRDVDGTDHLYVKHWLDGNGFPASSVEA